MPRIKLKAKDQKTFDRLKKAVDATVVIQKQKTLTYGRWDFVVMGAAETKRMIVRVGYAEQTKIHRAPLYVASLGKPGWMNMNSVPIEEFIGEDFPEEYQGLEIYQLDPIRPLKISEKKSVPLNVRTTDQICREYENQNIALIQAPRDADWAIAVMKYLHECDQVFPDLIQESFLTQASSRGNRLQGPSLRTPN